MSEAHYVPGTLLGPLWGLNSKIESVFHPYFANEETKAQRD